MIHYLMIFAGRIVVHASDACVLAQVLNTLGIDARNLRYEDRADGIFAEGKL